MKNAKYVFGPVPSRRLGASLGVSPIPEKTCNYSCVYCQLGRTTKMINDRRCFFPVATILTELKQRIAEGVDFDVISIVGEGEPTLYSELGKLIAGAKALSDKPVAVITNGALLSDPALRRELAGADIVLPSMDAFDEESFHKIDRPHGKIDFSQVCAGLAAFSNEYKGQLWLEIMLVDGLNTSDEALSRLAAMAEKVRHDRLYINTPVRPPAEDFAQAASPETIKKLAEMTGGISIDMLTSGAFGSDEEDSLEAVISIARRHPMNSFEIQGLLSSRGEDGGAEFFGRLEADARVSTVEYKGIKTYRVR